MPPRPQLLQGEGAAATSATSAASNNNNSGGVCVNYGSISNNNGDDEERLPLIRMSMSEESLLETNKKKKNVDCHYYCENKRILYLIVLTLGAVAVLSTILYVVAPLFNNNNGSNNNNNNNENPFLLHPVNDLGLLSVVKRQRDASPSVLWGDHYDHAKSKSSSSSSSTSTSQPLPTNSWYLNLLSHKAASVGPDDSTSVYTVPYIVDTAAAVSSSSSSSSSTTTTTTTHIAAGIRLHWPVVQTSTQNIQMVRDFKNSLTIGMMSINASKTKTIPYRVRYDNEKEPLSPLGVTLEWGDLDLDNHSNSNDNHATTTTTTTMENNDRRHRRLSSHNNKQQEDKPSTPSSSSSSSSSSTNTPPPYMTTHIVRGMAYATMIYQNGAMPVIYSFNGLSTTATTTTNNNNNNSSSSSSGIIIDGDDSTTSTLTCKNNNNNNKTNTGDTTTTAATATVQQSIKLHFINSDFTWMVFFSQPVQVQCHMSDGDQWSRDFALHVVDYDTSTTTTTTKTPLTVRVALLNQCTTGKSNIQQHCTNKDAQWHDPKGYERLLKQHFGVYPTSPQLEIVYPQQQQQQQDDDENDNNSSESSTSSSKTTTTTTTTTTDIAIDWGATSAITATNDNKSSSSTMGELLMFALPHHQELLQQDKSNGSKNTATTTTITDHCTDTFHGRTCLVQGSHWTLHEDVGEPLSFWAPRPPQAAMIPDLAKALLSQDIHYQLSANLKRGAADTYFSGKILARYARVIVIAHELKLLADDDVSLSYLQTRYGSDLDVAELRASRKAAQAAKLPSAAQIASTVEHLKQGVRAWLDSDAEAPFVFDESWGGLVNCGCRYVGKGPEGYCNNTFPDCPALVDVNEDFGNGYYNDHHYHYGYHLYAAAVAAKFDPKWALEFVDDILLYVRDFANPVSNDPYFPPFRQKDWYLGSSWASGIVSAENSPHGRNEESSSEAISAYEAVALFGSAMMNAYEKSGSSNKNQMAMARLVQQSGQLLTSTELAATNRYWHVWNSTTHKGTYPSAYQQPVVGMMYDTMAEFGTWFSQWPLVSYGIQLLPLTPVAERRDDPEWAGILYPQYEKACHDAGDFCTENGWSILQAGLLATAGHPQEALQQALAVPDAVFETQGGMGNSRSNTIWYIATRKAVNESVLSVLASSASSSNNNSSSSSSDNETTR